MSVAAPAASDPTPRSRWTGKPVQALLVRGVVYLGPMLGSLLFVHFASRIVPPPLGSLKLYLVWWLGISALATVVLVAADRVLRRLLPLAALLKLSLIFPDQAPSRFKVAFRSGSTEGLAERLKPGSRNETPSEAAARLLELVAALNIHDGITRGHCDRVRAYAVMIGQELGLERHELDLLNWAALLHDVGKLKVPAEILNKEGKPTDEEWEALRNHPAFGEELVEPIKDWLGPWTASVGYHHERWDGKGYPHGLAGEDIPLAGRIVAVADVFDVITSARSYKKASTTEDARKEIAACAGTQFDPVVVRALFSASLGRLRFVMGPLSWLAHAPMLGRLPLTPALGTFTGALSVAATSVAAGVVATPAAATDAAAPPPAQVVHTAPAPKPAPVVTHPRVKHHPPAPRHVVRPARHVVVPPVTLPSAPTEPPPPPATEAPTPAPAPAPTPTPTPTPLPVPLLTASDDATVYEGSTTQLDVLANDQGDAPLHLVSVEAPAHGSAGTSGSSVVYSAALDYQGDVTVTYHVIDAAGAVGSGTVKFKVLPVNHAPSFQPGGDVASAEDAGPVVVPWATAIEDGSGDSGQAVHFAVSASNGGLFSTAPTVSADGSLSYTAAPDAFGTSHVTVTAVDDGGTAHGGVDTSAPQAFTLTVSPVNDAPRFTAGPNVSVTESASTPDVRQWATGISPGPANESAQHVSFVTSDDNAALFTVSGRPSISSDGVLSFTPAAFATGSATVTVTELDDGGTANGGHDSAGATFTITVLASNQPPSFTGAGNQTVNEDAGGQSLQWATSISPGPANESSQTVTFSASNNNNALFSAQPSISNSGLLTYTPAANAFGTATVTATATDNGGTANGGVDTHSATFTITVQSVNDAPTLSALADQTVNEDDGPQTVTSFAGTSAGPSNESSQTLSISLTSNNSALFDAAGQPAIDAFGTLTYTPASGAYGTATVTVTVQDNGGTANGGHDTTTGSFVVTVNAIPPVAGDDAYDTTLGTTLDVTNPALGLLANDADANASPLSVTPFSGATSQGGTVTVASDGTFHYTPALLFVGTDSFTYQVSDGLALTSSATVTISVTALASSLHTLYLQTSGLSSDVWALNAGAPGNVAPVPDLDGDNNPGVSIHGSDGHSNNTDPQKQQQWGYEVGGLLGLSLSGPLTVHLTAASQNFHTNKAETIVLYVYDCPGNLAATSIASCTVLGTNQALVPQWNTTAAYAQHSVTVPVNATVASGRQLRIRLLIKGEELWIPLVGPYQSSIDYTG